MKDYYEILEVSRKASKDTINKVFKMHMKANHPDLFQGEEKTKAEERSKEFTEAYNVLSDDDARAKYDMELEEEEKTGGNASMLQTVQEENEYLKQVIAQKNDYIARLTGGYNPTPNPVNQNNSYYADDEEFGEPTFGHNANQNANNPYQGMTEEEMAELSKKERMSYFIGRLKGMGSELLVLLVLATILITSLIVTIKNVTSYMGK